MKLCYLVLVFYPLAFLSGCGSGKEGGDPGIEGDYFVFSPTHSGYLPFHGDFYSLDRNSQTGWYVHPAGYKTDADYFNTKRSKISAKEESDKLILLFDAPSTFEEETSVQELSEAGWITKAQADQYMSDFPDSFGRVWQTNQTIQMTFDLNTRQQSVLGGDLVKTTTDTKISWAVAEWGEKIKTEESNNLLVKALQNPYPFELQEVKSAWAFPAFYKPDMPLSIVGDEELQPIWAAELFQSTLDGQSCSGNTSVSKRQYSCTINSNGDLEILYADNTKQTIRRVLYQDPLYAVKTEFFDAQGNYSTSIYAYAVRQDPGFQFSEGNLILPEGSFWNSSVNASLEEDWEGGNYKFEWHWGWEFFTAGKVNNLSYSSWDQDGDGIEEKTLDVREHRWSINQGVCQIVLPMGEDCKRAEENCWQRFWIPLASFSDNKKILVLDRGLYGEPWDPAEEEQFPFVLSLYIPPRIGLYEAFEKPRVPK